MVLVIAGVLGTLLACGAYTGFVAGKLRPRTYAGISLLSCVLIGASLIAQPNTATALLEAYFAVVSVWALIKGAKDLSLHKTLRLANLARQAEWDPTSAISLSYRGVEMAGEAGEACNVLKKIERERLGLPGSRDTLDHLAEELADVIICADLIAMSEGIDLDLAIRRKFNATSEQVGLKTRMEVPA